VLSAGPELAARVAVTLLLALGAGLVVGGIAAVRRFRDADARHAAARPAEPAPVS
jgi:hypothetical protein